MIYVKRDSLTIIEIQNGINHISLHTLKEIILNSPSNVIYFEEGGELYGIISMGDIARACESGTGHVALNRHFTRVSDKEYLKAKDIFRINQNINAIPVVNDDNFLIGNYLRWDDLLYKTNINGEDIDGCRYVIFVRPGKRFAEKQGIFEQFKSYMESKGITVSCIDCEEIGNYIGSVDRILFVDTDECRAVYTLYQNILNKDLGKTQFHSFKRFIKDCCCEKKEEYLRDLEKNGIHIIALDFDSDEDDKYDKRLTEEIRDKYDAVGKKVNGALELSMYPEFFDDLYSEEYANEIVNIRYSIETKSGCGKLKDMQSALYHVSNGERYTYGQPKDYEKTIWFIGACYIYGHYAEDKNTIESLLQKRMNEKGYNIRVVNCGSPAYCRDTLLYARIRTLPLRRGDIIVLPNDNFHNIKKINLMNLCKKHHVSAKWMADHPAHCNHHLNLLYAAAVYDEVERLLAETERGQGEPLEKKGDFIRELYIDKYFKDLDFTKRQKTGCIVMNCNPFTYGHRYLIEQALDIVDCLLIFVVEEDKSVFSFEERFAMVSDGVRDLVNVVVIPSGPFILAQTTFPEYFLKIMDGEIVQNVENDITLFAERIAPYLNIQYRFVGEEPDDMVTNEYNAAMKRILPPKGIKVVEIPRKKQNGRHISASLVRKYLEKKDTDRLHELIPETTLKILFSGNS